MTSAASPKSFTFKVSLGEGELRRVSLTRDTPLASLLASLASPSSPLFLTYQDEEGDPISIKTQQDLAECLSFMEGASLSLLKLQATLAPSSSPTPAATTSTPATPTAATPSTLTLSSTSDASATSAVPTAPEACLSSPLPAAQCGEPLEGPEADAQAEEELEAELRELAEEETGSLSGISLVPQKLRTRLEALDARFARKEQHLAAAVAKLKAHPLFSEEEHQRQRGVLEEARVPPSPFLDVLLLKRQLQAAAKRGRGGEGAGRRGERGEAWSPLTDPKMRRFSEETLQRLDLLHRNGLPGGPLMAKYLERSEGFHGCRRGHRGGRHARRADEQGEPGAQPQDGKIQKHRQRQRLNQPELEAELELELELEHDPSLVQRQLEELEDLAHIPREALVFILTRANSRGGQGRPRGPKQPRA